MITKVIINIENETDSNALVISLKGQEGFNNNPYFILPPILAAAWLVIILDFKDKLTKAKYGKSADTIAKNIARLVLNDTYRLNAIYANMIANGDKVICESSKLPIYDPIMHKTPLDQEARDLKASGSIAVYSRLKPKDLIARFIQITQTPQDETSWENAAIIKKQKVILHDLPTDLRTYVRIALMTNPTEFAFGNVFSILVT